MQKLWGTECNHVHMNICVYVYVMFYISVSTVGVITMCFGDRPCHIVVNNVFGK